jgi:hypothetical protein
MRSLLLCLAIVAAASALARAQDEKKMKNDKPVILVTGCLDGSWLRVSAADTVGGGYVERYRLHGTKSLLKEMAAKYIRTPDRSHRRRHRHRQHDAPREDHPGRQERPNLYRGEGSPRRDRPEAATRSWTSPRFVN